MRRTFPAAEWEDNDNHGEEEGYYNLHTGISTSVDRREETEESTCTVKEQVPDIRLELFESAEQHKKTYLSTAR